MKQRARRAVVAIVVLGAFVLSVGGPPAQAQRQGHAGAAPHAGGTVTAGLFTEPGCLDPLKYTTGVNDEIWDQVFDTLLSLDGRGQDRPDLALGWTFSHGGRWITFSLRHGVRFSNGDPLDATAVKYTLEHDAKWAPVGHWLGPIDSVQVVDRYTVRLILPAPSRPLLYNLTNSYLGILDPRVEGQQGDAACQAPVGSGAFKVASVGPGYSTFTLVPNPLHTWNPPWMHQGPAYLSSLVFKAVVDPTTTVSELLTGELDTARVLGAELPRIQHAPGLALHQFLESQEQYLGFNTAHSPFDNAAVRRAFAEAIDRDTLVKVVLAGKGAPAYSVIPALDPFYDAQSQRYAPPYNPADARRFFAANHITGPYTLLVPNIPAWPPSAEFIQAELAQVGVKINVVVKPGLENQMFYRRGAYDLLIQPFFGNDLYGPFHSSQLGLPGTFNFTFYRNATLDRLIEQSRETTDPGRAAAILVELQRFMNQQVVVDPLFSRLLTVAARSRLQGWHMRAGDIFPVFRDVYVEE
jgi:peptide/nickel transport system substrate-binding protein